MQRIKKEVVTTSPIIWVHCSSVGEFEQARPIIEWYKTNKTQYKILVTFFSPSGYELRKCYKYADWVFYLPADTSRNAREFLKIVKPHKAIFIKYEFWFNYLHQLKENNIETYIVAAIFRPSQYFFKWYGAPFRKMLNCYTKIFVQDTKSKDLLSSYGISKNVEIYGDPRFDRVYQITKNTPHFPNIEEFVSDSFTIIAGSTWQPDETLLERVIKNFPNTKLIIAPHEIGPKRIAEVEKCFKTFNTIKHSLISTYSTQKIKEANVLIIDSIGILSSLYRYGKFAYIGGGFGEGLHNILEAAVYGTPVIFGPRFKKFKEATDLLKLGGATSVRNTAELYSIFRNLIYVPTLLEEKGDICYKYVKSNLGATQKITSQIEKHNKTI